jgi:hypothetical protein
MIRLPLVCSAVVFGSGTLALGGRPSFELSVAVGQYDRANVPVCVAFSREQMGDRSIRSAFLARTDGQPIPAQWTSPCLDSSAAGELHFILPHLASGKSIRLNATLSTELPSTRGGFTWHDHPGHHSDLLCGELSTVASGRTHAAQGSRRPEQRLR